MSQTQTKVLSPFRPGSLIAGKYEIVNTIGDGGMGLIVAAKHVDLGETVALKFLRPEALQDRDLVALFADEARAAARIKSEYVARVYDVGTLSDGAPFLVMEYLEGEDLAQLLERRGPLPSKAAVEYVMQACEGLAAAHALGITHRDVKPENLFLARRAHGMDAIKVLDFGIAKHALSAPAADAQRATTSRLNLPMGSPLYMSPEQIRGSEQIDARSDIWSLGCVLYELLTGRTAFDAPTVTQVGALVLEQDPPALRSIQPDAPPELEAIINRCLCKNPEGRFQNVAELAVALYPFGPRRARISAERCSFMLASAGAEDARDIELASVPPPGAPEPEVAESLVAATIVLAPSETRSIERADAVQPRKRSRVIFGLVLLAGVAAGGAAWLWQNDMLPGRQAAGGPVPPRAMATAPSESTKQPDAVTGESERERAENAATAAAAVPSATGATSATSPAPKSSRARSGAGAAARTTAPARAPRPARTRPVRAPSDEVDVGF